MDIVYKFDLCLNIYILRVTAKSNFKKLDYVTDLYMHSHMCIYVLCSE